MTPWVLSRISESNVELYDKVRHIFDVLPDLEFGTADDGNPILVSCHILAQALAEVFSLKIEVGWYYPNFQHSWLKLSDETVLDVCPVGVYCGPLLVDRMVAKWLYLPLDPSSTEWIKREYGGCSKPVQKTVREIRKLLDQ